MGLVVTGQMPVNPLQLHGLQKISLSTTSRWRNQNIISRRHSHNITSRKPSRSIINRSRNTINRNDQRRIATLGQRMKDINIKQESRRKKRPSRYREGRFRFMLSNSDTLNVL
jgi:hypothetical protein